MTATITQVPGSGVQPNAGRTIWNNNDQALADEINAHESSTTSAHGGLISLPNLDWKPSVRAASQANKTLSGTQIIDDISLVAGDRVLIKQQTTGSDNGIYVVAAGAWSRATDASSSTTVHPRMTVSVSEGTVSGGLTYQITNTGTINLGTTSLTFGLLGSSTLTPGSYTVSSITVGASGQITAVASGAAGAVADASTSVKGAVLMSAAPVSSTSPIAVGSNDPTLQTKIEGLSLTWDSATQLGVETGCAWVPSLNKVLDVPTRLTLAVSSPGVNTKQYIYLTSAGALEASTTVPVAYKGFAKQKTGDNTRRYLGMVLGNAAGTGMYKWRAQPDNTIRYLENMGSGSVFQVSAGGVATTETTVSCSAVIPPTSTLAKTLLGSWASAYLVIGNSEDTLALTAGPTNSNTSKYLYQSYPGGNVVTVGVTGDILLDASQAFTYRYISAPAAVDGLYLSVQGYLEAR